MMRNYILSGLCLFLSLGSEAQSVPDFSLKDQLESYNVKWTTQSANSSESMPLGGGDIGLNVWVEKGDILFYMSQSGTFDENNQFLKLGRVRIRLEPNVFLDDAYQFSQELKLQDGYVQIKALNGQKEVNIDLWVNVLKPIINVEVHGTEEVKITAYYENWRNNERIVPEKERHACFSYSGYPGQVITYPDSVQFQNNNVLWYHRNRPDKLLIDFSINQQGLSDVKEQMIDTQKDLTFGGAMSGKTMKVGETGNGKYIDTPFNYWSLTSEKAERKHELKIVLITSQVKSVEEWKENLLSIQSTTSIEDWTQTKEWWHTYWERSYIFINTKENNPKDKGWQVGRNYQLFRYQLGCNAYGKYPTKFNGGLFTVDPQFVQVGKNNYSGTPDFRAWGGGSFTAQNQRLVYWPMLKSGDFDMMAPQFNFYKRALKNAELRTEVYWGHEGCSFTEQIENFGLPFAGGWGFDSGSRKRDANTPWGEQTNPWVKHHYTAQLEFSFMILKYYQYTGNDISVYMPFIKSATNFFFEHYQYRYEKQTGKKLDDDGKLVIFPSTAAETYKNVKNPTDLCAALKAVVGGIVKLPENYISEDERSLWEEKALQIPDLSFGKLKGHKVLVPAKDLPEPINQEIMELYPVFPYELYGIGYPDLQVALDTWKYGDFTRNHVSWHQDGIFAARLGLTEEAKRITILKLQDSERRFPTFWGPGHDYVPDHNWGGSGMIGLQDMLVQFVEDEIHLLPSWPDEWNVIFKLHGPDNTKIECEVNDGNVIMTEVNPPANKSKIR